MPRAPLTDPFHRIYSGLTAVVDVLLICSWRRLLYLWLPMKHVLLALFVDSCWELSGIAAVMLVLPRVAVTFHACSCIIR